MVKFMTKMVIFTQSNNNAFWVINKSRERKSDACLNTTRQCVMSLMQCADAPFFLVTGE